MAIMVMCCVGSPCCAGKSNKDMRSIAPLVFPNYHLLPSRWVLCLIVLILCTFLHALVFHCGCYGHVGVPHCVVVLPMEEQWACEKCHPPWWFSTITFLKFLLYYWPTHFKACNDTNLDEEMVLKWKHLFPFTCIQMETKFLVSSQVCL